MVVCYSSPAADAQNFTLTFRKMLIKCFFVLLRLQPQTLILWCCFHWIFSVRLSLGLSILLQQALPPRKGHAQTVTKPGYFILLLCSSVWGNWHLFGPQAVLAYLQTAISQGNYTNSFFLSSPSGTKVCSPKPFPGLPAAKYICWGFQLLLYQVHKRAAFLEYVWRENVQCFKTKAINLDQDNSINLYYVVLCCILFSMVVLGWSNCC